MSKKPKETDLDRSNIVALYHSDPAFHKLVVGPNRAAGWIIGLLWRYVAENHTGRKRQNVAILENGIKGAALTIPGAINEIAGTFMNLGLGKALLALGVSKAAITFMTTIMLPVVASWSVIAMAADAGFSRRPFAALRAGFRETAGYPSPKG